MSRCLVTRGLYSFDKTIDWLLSGDISIQNLTHRDLLDEDKPELTQRIHTEGWG